MKHVACGNTRTALGIQSDVTPDYKSITAKNLFCFRIPDYELTTRRIHQIKLVDIATFACAATGHAECDFTKPSDFVHDSLTFAAVHHIYFIIPFVGRAQQPVTGKFALYEHGVNRVYYFFGHLSIISSYSFFTPADSGLFYRTTYRLLYVVLQPEPVSFFRLADQSKAPSSRYEYQRCCRRF